MIYIAYVINLFTSIYLFWIGYRIDGKHKNVNQYRLVGFQKKYLFYQKGNEQEDSIHYLALIYETFIWAILLFETIALIVISIFRISGNPQGDAEFVLSVVFFCFSLLAGVLSIVDMIIEFIKEIISDYKNRE